MKSEEKVKQVYPSAFIYSPQEKVFYCIAHEGEKGYIGYGCDTRRAWAAAWNHIQDGGKVMGKENKAASKAFSS